MVLLCVAFLDLVLGRGLPIVVARRCEIGSAFATLVPRSPSRFPGLVTEPISYDPVDGEKWSEAGSKTEEAAQRVSEMRDAISLLPPSILLTHPFFHKNKSTTSP